ncbi:MAG: hypothetical protein KJI69_04910 [Patescibacteria group bacterium]|nr:hypothetical protein [Patescibacteria group bacterium]
MQYKIQTTQEKVLEGENLIRQNGGSVVRNSFEISGVSGRYSFEDGTLTINISDKPWLASWSMIEQKVNEFFG